MLRTGSACMQRCMAVLLQLAVPEMKPIVSVSVPPHLVVRHCETITLPIQIQCDDSPAATISVISDCDEVVVPASLHRFKLKPNSKCAGTLYVQSLSLIRARTVTITVLSDEGTEIAKTTTDLHFDDGNTLSPIRGLRSTAPELTITPNPIVCSTSDSSEGAARIDIFNQSRVDVVLKDLVPSCGLEILGTCPSIFRAGEHHVLCLRIKPVRFGAPADQGIILNTAYPQERSYFVSVCGNRDEFRIRTSPNKLLVDHFPSVGEFIGEINISVHAIPDHISDLVIVGTSGLSISREVASTELRLAVTSMTVAGINSNESVVIFAPTSRIKTEVPVVIGPKLGGSMMVADSIRGGIVSTTALRWRSASCIPWPACNHWTDVLVERVDGDGPLPSVSLEPGVPVGTLLVTADGAVASVAGIRCGTVILHCTKCGKRAGTAWSVVETN